MRKTFMITMAAGALLAAGAETASGQASRWAFEGRLNMSVPLGDLADDNAESALGFGADLFYTFIPNMSAYAGLSRHSFGCDGLTCSDLTSTGLQAGVKYLFGAERRVMPWVRGGIMVFEAASENVDADLALGAEAGGGVDVMFAPRFGLTPALHYHTYKADFGAGELNMNYLTISLAAHFHF